MVRPPSRIAKRCPFSIATYLMPQVVNRFSQAFPDAELFMEAGHSDFAFQQLTDGLVNLAFAAAFPRILSQAQTLLRLHDEMVVAARTNHELAGVQNIPISQLWHYQPVIIHWGRAFDAYVESLQQMSQVQKPMVRVPLPAALPMVQQPQTITFVPRRLTAVSDLIELNVPDFQFDWDIVLITRMGRELSELEWGFVDLVTAVWHNSEPGQ